MRISISGPHETKSHAFQHAIANRLIRTLDRFSRRIDRVDVAIIDENGPRGGVDKLCRIRVHMPGVEPFAVTARGETVWAALSLAATRVRRKVTTSLKRPRSQRERFRRHRWRDTVENAHAEFGERG